MENRFKRVTVYISEQEWRELKATLALQGLTISEWFRRMATKEIDEKNNLPID